MSSAPRRIRLSRAKGWRMPDNTVKVDRSTRWGNPFVIVNDTIDERQSIVRRFRLCVTQPASFRRHQILTVARGGRAGEGYFLAIKTSIEDLRGKNLACWCALDQPCHADVLLEIANAPEVTP